MGGRWHGGNGVESCANHGRPIEKLEVGKIEEERQQLTNKEKSYLKREKGLESVEQDQREAQGFVKFQD